MVLNVCHQNDLVCNTISSRTERFSEVSTDRFIYIKPGTLVFSALDVHTNHQMALCCLPCPWRINRLHYLSRCSRCWSSGLPECRMPQWRWLDYLRSNLPPQTQFRGVYAVWAGGVKYPRIYSRPCPCPGHRGIWVSQSLGGDTLHFLVHRDVTGEKEEWRSWVQEHRNPHTFRWRIQKQGMLHCCAADHGNNRCSASYVILILLVQSWLVNGQLFVCLANRAELTRQLVQLFVCLAIQGLVQEPALLCYHRQDRNWTFIHSASQLVSYVHHRGYLPGERELSNKLLIHNPSFHVHDDTHLTCTLNIDSFNIHLPRTFNFRYVLPIVVSGGRWLTPIVTLILSRPYAWRHNLRDWHRLIADPDNNGEH